MKRADISEGSRNELVLLAGRDAGDLAARADAIVKFLDQAPGAPLQDVAYTCACGFESGAPATLALVAHSPACLRSRLVSAAGKLRAGAERIREKSGTYYCAKRLLGGEGGGRLAFMFPGAGSFYPNMLRGLAVRFRECRLPFDELEAALAGTGLFQPSLFVFPPAAHYSADADVFAYGAYAEAVVSTYSANAGMARLLEALGVRPDGALGFAGGDLNALAACGAFGRKFDRKRRLEFLRETYATVKNAVSRAGLPACEMVTYVAPQPGAAEAALEGFAAEDVQKAYDLSPKHGTLAVRPEALEAVLGALGAARVRCVRLKVDRPFNTPWCAKMLPLFRKLAGRWIDCAPELPVYSCGSAEPLPPKARKARDEAADQWVRPVRFAETLRRMHADGFRVFLEAGPQGLMANAAEDVLKGEEHAALALDSTHGDGFVRLQHVLGQLAALGAKLDAKAVFAQRRPGLVDFSAPLSLDVRVMKEKRLARAFPRPVPPEGAGQAPLMSAGLDEAPAGGRRKDARRAARGGGGFVMGPAMPLVSDARVEVTEQGARTALKTYTFAKEPFFADFAIGSPNISFSDRSLRGHVPLHPMAGAEIMAEAAQALAPDMRLCEVEDLKTERRTAFADGRLKLLAKAERVESDDAGKIAVRARLYDAPEGAEWEKPVMEGVFKFTAAPEKPAAFVPPPLSRPRDVHWTHDDIYPDRLFSGERLQRITGADRWCETGLDYTVHSDATPDALSYTQIPVWTLNPILLAAVADGFRLWRSHERFPGAFSYPARVRRITLHARCRQGMELKCYLRNSGVTPKSVLADIHVSDGNGKLMMEFDGYEEFTERVPVEYGRLLVEPPLAYLTKPLPEGAAGPEGAAAATAYVTDVRYGLFEKNEELWLKVLSQMALHKSERREFARLPGSAGRRTEWLFGRIAAKEAVRRFMNANYQARWCDADVQIWRDDSGKPHPIGEWKDMLKTPVDLAIAHTAEFVVAIVAANARAGVDVESRERELSAEFMNGVFTPAEQELAVNAVDAPCAALRFWCAKEAVSKALGTGIRYPPKELVVEGFDPAAGEMEVRLTGQWLEAFRQFSGRTVKVSSTLVKGHVLATCFIPEGTFA